jgi:hypothetical protein
MSTALHYLRNLTNRIFESRMQRAARQICQRQKLFRRHP